MPRKKRPAASSRPRPSGRPGRSGLPREPDEVWQADVRRLPTWVVEQGEPQRPTAALVVSCSSNLILAQDLTLGGSVSELLRSAVRTAILEPMAPVSHLPGTIEVSRPEFAELLRQDLQPLNIDCRVRPELELLSTVFGELVENLTVPEGMPSLIDTPGVTPAEVEGLFEAAAAYYLSQPWTKCPGDAPIRIQAAGLPVSTWYGVVMGQLGIEPGLVLSPDLETLRGSVGTEQDINCREGLSLMYGREYDIAIRDLEMAEEQGWPIATPEAHPICIQLGKGVAIRGPLPWELKLVEGCLRVIPAFLTRRGAAATKMIAPTASGDLPLELQWLE